MMDNRNTHLDEIPADSVPAPVCRFDFENGTALVRGVNQLFDEQLLAVQRGEPLATVFEACELSEAWETVETALRRGGQFTLSTPDETRYRVDVTPPEDSAAGYLLLTEITALSAGGKGASVPSSGEEGEHTTPGEERTAESAETTGATTDETTPSHDGLAVDHVASVVSHDLRNPLDVARARLQAAREFEEDEHFDHIEQAHDRMERIIQDVLTLARGEDVVAPDERVDLGVIAEQAWETVETNGATLTVEDDLPTALADPDRVSRLFENLFRNSVEHSKDPPADSVQITVGQLTDDDTDGFYVADDGPGIPEDQKQRVFEPGYSSDEHGTGLGLAIVARIADLHGWSVTVTESAEDGARFEMRGVE